MTWGIDASSALTTRVTLLGLLAFLVLGISVVAVPSLLDDSPDELPFGAPSTDAPAEREATSPAGATDEQLADATTETETVARISAAGIVFDGTIPTEGQRDALVHTARRLVGPEAVEDRLVVTTGATSSVGLDNGVVGLQTFLTAVPDGVEVAATATVGRLVVVGEAADENALSAIERALDLAVAGSPDTVTVSNVTVPPPPPPTREEVLAAAQRALDPLNAELVGRVLFATGSNEPTAEFTEVLDRLGAVLDQHPSVSVAVVGHTDDRGSAEGNLELSRQRAQAAVDYLVSVGVEPGRLDAEGMGETVPVATNETRDGRARNRRVELVAR